MTTLLLALFVAAAPQPAGDAPQHATTTTTEAPDEPLDDKKSAQHDAAREPAGLRLDLSWSPESAQGYAPTLRMSLQEVFDFPDPAKARRLSMWDAPLGRVMYATRQPEAAAGHKPWSEHIGLDLVVPDLRLRWVDSGPLGDWFFENPDKKTRRQLLGTFMVQTALPLLDDLLN